MSQTSPLLGDAGGCDGAGQPIEQQKQPAPTGWQSSVYIIGMQYNRVEVAERFAYIGIVGNLVTCLTNVLNESTATAVKNVNICTGVSTILPLFGAFIADSYLGRYHTILFSSVVYILGLAAMTLTVAMANSRLQEALFFRSLYLVVIGESGHKPCVQAFGADQFDESSEEERRAKNSFFNWWYFGLCIGASTSMLFMFYLQDNVGWTISFGILATVMSLALALFLLGRRLYRRQAPSGNPLTHVARVLVAATRKLHLSSTVDNDGQKLENGWFHIQTDPRRPLPSTNQFRVLDKASIIEAIRRRLCSSTQVEDGIHLVPIWFSCLMYGVVIAQANTFFTKQSSTIDRKIFSLVVPSASLQVTVSLAAIVTVPIYDWVIVPITRRITGTPSGLTMLQRIGVGMFLSVISMVVEALVESRRLRIARELELVDLPHATIPMTVLWMLPQYLLCGVSDVFTMVGLQELFHDQMQDELRTLGAAAYLSTFGIGSFLSSGIISIVERNNSGWLVDNLNHGHLDYHYWILAGLGTLWFGLYLCAAKHFCYKRIDGILS